MTEISENFDTWMTVTFKNNGPADDRIYRDVVSVGIVDNNAVELKQFFGDNVSTFEVKGWDDFEVEVN